MGSATYIVVPQTPSSPHFPTFSTINQKNTRNKDQDARMSENSYSPSYSMESPKGAATMARRETESDRFATDILEASQKLKVKIYIMRFISRLLGTVLAIATLSLETHTIRTFMRTHRIQHEGRGPWAKETSLWPSTMLLAVSVITAVLGLVTLFAYTRSIKTANRVSFHGTWIAISIEVIHVTAWIVVAVLYRKGKTGKDLWGWACSPLAEKIQPNFEGVVNFSAVCRRGDSNWILSTINAAATVFGLSIWYFVYQRDKYIKLQKKLESNSEVPGDF